jgi:5-methylcytosine-specific restriction protein B
MSLADNRGASAPDEASMRADESKQRRYEELLDSPYFMQVVEANRAYLTAAVPDAAETEGDYWVLSCLPGQRNTLSRVSMGRMEMFALFVPEDETSSEIEGLVIVARSVLEEGFGSIVGFQAGFQRLEVTVSGYQDAGDDQVRVSGSRSDLVRALWHEPFGAAARALAEHLMRKKTVYRRGHNYLLADHVLGRA